MRWIKCAKYAIIKFISGAIEATVSTPPASENVGFLIHAFYSYVIRFETVIFFGNRRIYYPPMCAFLKPAKHLARYNAERLYFLGVIILAQIIILLRT